MSALSTHRSSDAMSAGLPQFRGVRISKFRHVYGQGARRENCYEGLRIGTSAHDSQLCAVNPKFLACIIEVAGGGAFQVIPLKWMGKVDYHFGRVSGHNGPVTDLKWNPFNDNVIASASDDSTIKIWHIADDMHKHNTTEWLIELCGHSRRISYIDWHPTTENVLASAALDHRILLWNVGTGECVVEIDSHPDTIYSMAFNKCGSLLATTCKDHMLRVVDARTGQVLQQGPCHDGAKAAKVVFVSDEDKLLTTGANKASRRQLAVWDRNDLSRPLLLQEIDSSSGLLVPIYDQDLSIAYIAGKGDGNVRYYEITDTHPYIHYLSEFQSRFPQRGLGVMPKRGLNVAQCEVFRFYKVHATQSLVEPISFIVPRKSETFQTDLYPPTAGATPALTADEWLCGMNKKPVVVSLSTGSVPTTCKPVQVVKCASGDGQMLITADRNNDRKFRFLSEVTKPDYREVTQREDYDDIRRLREVQEKLSERIAMRQSSESGDSSIGSPRQSKTALSHDDVFRHRTQSPSFPPPRSPGASSAPMTVRVPSSSSNGVTSTHSPNKIRRTESPLPEVNGNGNATDSTLVRRSHSPLLGRVVERPSSVTGSVEPAASASSGSSAQPRTSTEQSRLPTYGARSKTVLKPAQTASESVSTRPGSIGPRPIVPREQTATVKPFRVHSSQSREPTPLASIRSASLGEHQQQHVPPVAVEPQPSSAKDNDLHKLYTAQCARVREMMAADDLKERRMTQLEMDVATMASKYEQLLIERKRQQDDIESLRYEIDWKDQRIAYLERQLGTAVASQQRDESSSPEP